MPLKRASILHRPRQGYVLGSNGKVLRWLDFTLFLPTTQYLTDDQGHIITDDAGNRIRIAADANEALLPDNVLIVNP